MRWILDRRGVSDAARQVETRESSRSKSGTRPATPHPGSYDCMRNRPRNLREARTNNDELVKERVRNTLRAGQGPVNKMEFFSGLPRSPCRDQPSRLDRNPGPSPAEPLRHRRPMTDRLGWMGCRESTGVRPVAGRGRRGYLGRAGAWGIAWWDARSRDKWRGGVGSGWARPR